MPEKISWMDTNLALSEYPFSLHRLPGCSTTFSWFDRFCLLTLFFFHSSGFACSNKTTGLLRSSVGSELDHKVKEAAAGGEEAWEGIGTEAGVLVWRVENFAIQPWPEERYGALRRKRTKKRTSTESMFETSRSLPRSCVKHTVSAPLLRCDPSLRMPYVRTYSLNLEHHLSEAIFVPNLFLSFRLQTIDSKVH